MEIVPLWVTRILSAVMYFFGLLDSEERGGWTGLFAAASPDFTREDSGAYVVPYSKIATPSALAMDEQLADKLYTYSEDQLRQRGLLEDL